MRTFDGSIARRLHNLPVVDSTLNQRGCSTDGVHCTIGTRYAIISVSVFFVMRREYHTKPCRDTLTYMPIWTEIYETFVIFSSLRYCFPTPFGFNFQHLVRRVYHTKPCRDTLTNMPIWTEIYGTLVYKYYYLMLLYFRPRRYYFPTPPIF